MNSDLFRLAARQAFSRVAGKLIPWFSAAAACSRWPASISAFRRTDRREARRAYRIIFIHVPAPGCRCYLRRHGRLGRLRPGDEYAALRHDPRRLRPGAMFTFIALWTGALWASRPGAYWVWDARLTSELVLLFLYLGFIALKGAIPDPARGRPRRRNHRAGRRGQVPIIYFSVHGGNTLHRVPPESHARARSCAGHAEWHALDGARRLDVQHCTALARIGAPSSSSASASRVGALQRGGVSEFLAMADMVSVWGSYGVGRFYIFRKYFPK